MPKRPLRPCSEPGSPALVQPPERYGSQHRHKAQERKAESEQYCDRTFGIKGSGSSTEQGLESAEAQDPGSGSLPLPGVPEGPAGQPGRHSVADYPHLRGLEPAPGSGQPRKPLPGVSQPGRGPETGVGVS